MSAATERVRYECKRCGSESPQGIGYLSDRVAFPAPAMGCPGLHIGDSWPWDEPAPWADDACQLRGAQ